MNHKDATISSISSVQNILYRRRASPHWLITIFAAGLADRTSSATRLRAMAHVSEQEVDTSSFGSVHPEGWTADPGRRYQTPGIHRERTRCVYSLYPANSSCNVPSSHRVRTSSTSEARPAGTSAHHEPRDRAMPTTSRQVPT